MSNQPEIDLDVDVLRKQERARRRMLLLEKRLMELEQSVWEQDFQRKLAMIQPADPGLRYFNSFDLSPRSYVIDEEPEL